MKRVVRWASTKVRVKPVPKSVHDSPDPNATKIIVHGTRIKPTEYKTLAHFPGRLQHILQWPVVSPQKLSKCKYKLNLQSRFVYPAVTSLVSATMSPQSRNRLEKWQKGQMEIMGVEAFDKMMMGKVQIGRFMHKLIETHLNGGQVDEKLIPSDSQLLAKAELYFDSVKPILRSIPQCTLMEKFVAHHALCYKGQVDTVAMYKDCLHLIEWKSASGVIASTARSNPDSGTASLFDHPLQVAAYVGAFNADATYPQQIRSALLVICFEDGSEARVYEMDEQDLRKYIYIWFKFF